MSNLNIWETLKAPFATRALFSGPNTVPAANIAKDNGFQDYALDPNGSVIATLLNSGPARGKSSINNPNGFSLEGYIATAATPTVTPTGGGASTWAYKIVARGANSIAAASTAGQTTTGVATLTGSAYNTITWTAVPNATSYDIYRTTTATGPTTTGLIGNVLATALLSFVDTGLAGDGSTAPTVNTTASLEAASFSDIVVNGLPAVQNTTITQSGTAGSTNYSYSVSAVTLVGYVSAAQGVSENGTAAAVQTTTGAATLTSVNTNIISWKAVPNAKAYNIYRTASSGTPSTTGYIGQVVATAAATLSFTDTGIAATGSVITTNTTGQINAANGFTAGTVTSAAIDPRVIQFASVTLSAANLIAMNATPVSILAAPGANKVILVDSIELQMKPTATQFTGGGAVTFVYHGGSVTPHASNIPAATITSASASNNQMPPIAAVIQPPTNTGIDITNATASFATGTGTAIVNIWYSVVPIQ